MARRLDSFGTRRTLTVGEKTYHYHSLPALAGQAGIGDITKLPTSLKVLLENLLRQEDGRGVTEADVKAMTHWEATAEPSKEIAFMPARVLLQDFTGVPVVVDLASMRDAIERMGGDATKINPLVPVDLVIDHSVQVDVYGTDAAFQLNSQLEYERNRERYAFLRWGQKAFSNFRVVPPDTGIVHQINLEYLATVAFTKADDGTDWVYPDTLVGTDSHTTMINGLGVVGWGVGGIEAEAALLGQPISMLMPQVVGFKLTGKMPTGATATDLVLTATQMLRKQGVVGKFVEFYGSGLANLSLADRATIANMAPEYGATIGFFPVDEKTLEYLRLTGRGESVALVRDYYTAQGMFHTPDSPEPSFSATLELDLSTVEPSLAGPKRPQDRVLLSDAKRSFRRALHTMLEPKLTGVSKETVTRWLDEGGALTSQQSNEGTIHTPEVHDVQTAVAATDLGLLGRTADVIDAGYALRHGSVVIAAITSCTNTSNPSVMVAAGLVAKRAVEFGLETKPWVKTSLAPGSKVVTEYLKQAGLMPYLDGLGFNLVGYGCTTCIGNSGPLPEAIAGAVTESDLVVTSVLSGNRNFEGRINPHVKANYLASPPLVVAYALAGTMDIDLNRDPLGTGKDGQPVYLADLWPSSDEIQAVVAESVRSSQFQQQYANVFEGDLIWQTLPTPTGDRFNWDDDSTYIKNPPYFEGLPVEPTDPGDITGARVLAMLGDSVTTDHISPAGSISAKGPAGRYLMGRGVRPDDFNSYGSRRGHDEVMTRGTFANIRLRNLVAPGTEGGVTRYLPTDETMSIYEAAEKYKADGTPLVVLAGAEYGTGSSRDWAAKGTTLLGVKAVLAESFERIHRSNLVGMGVLPLQFLPGESRTSLGLTGDETFDIAGIAEGLTPGKQLQITVRKDNGSFKTFSAIARVDTPNEIEYYRHGGILQYVLRGLLKGEAV